MINFIKKENRVLKTLGLVFSIFFFCICALLIFFNVTHEYHTVSGNSMLPTLNNNSQDGVFVSRIKPYNRGDIIVTSKGEKDLNGKDVLVIKRLIALGGEKVKVEMFNARYRIFIQTENGQMFVLEEVYLGSYDKNEDLYNKFSAMISKNEYQVDEDGFLSIPKDYVFYLGDNRSSSNDCANYGPMPEKNIIGKVDYIAYGNKNLYWQVLKQLFGGK